MRIPATCSLLVLLGLSSYAAADEMDVAMGRVRLTTDSSVTRGCTRITGVRDDSLKDLRRKIVRAGGDTALLSFSASELSFISADVYRCAGVAAQSPASPAASPRPAQAPADPPLWKPRAK